MAKKQKHYDYARLARARATEDWGREFESKDAALKGLTTEQVTEGALLELVRRLNQAIHAWSSDRDLGHEYDRDKRPDYAVPFPDAKLGDILYACYDLDQQEVAQLVVVSKDADGYVRTVALDTEPEKGRVDLSWGDNNCRASAAEAVLAQAEADIAYHAPLLRRAQAVAEAVRAGQPFESLMGEIEE